MPDHPTGRRTTSFQGQEPPPRGITHQVGLMTQAELVHHVRTMDLYSARADGERRSDPMVRKSLCGELQHFALARRQRLVGIFSGFLAPLDVYLDGALGEWCA